MATMRIRSTKPEFWSDERMGNIHVISRLVYKGLWNLADDAGWLRWNVAEIGTQLFGYDDRRERESWIATARDELVREGCLVIHDCGHAIIPKFTEHQRLAGETKRVLTMEKDHAKCVVPEVPRRSPPIPAENRRYPQSPTPVSGVRDIGKGAGDDQVAPSSLVPKGETSSSSSFERPLSKKTTKDDDEASAVRRAFAKVDQRLTDKMLAVLRDLADGYRHDDDESYRIAFNRMAAYILTFEPSEDIYKRLVSERDKRRADAIRAENDWNKVKAEELSWSGRVSA